MREQDRAVMRRPYISRESVQSAALILLRTAVGWHFLYEGAYKLLLPGWTRTGTPLPAWSAAGYLAHAGPAFDWMSRPPVIGWLDRLMPIALAAVGVSLTLGLFTRIGSWGAVVFLLLFYVSALPLTGLHQPGAEGAYLVVNKNLVELFAVFVLIAFDTGRIAGLDLLLDRRGRLRRSAAAGAVAR